MIDRSNYEIWFTDWLDKNLSASQIEELMLFVNANPDLKKEFENFTSMASLEPLKYSYPDHDKLRKTPSDITAFQFELLCVANMENDLDENQLADFDEIIRSDNERQKTFELISKTRLTPPEIRYGKKGLLKKHIIIRRVPFIISIVGAAASVIAIVFFSGVFTRTREVLVTENLTDTIYINRSVPNKPESPSGLLSPGLPVPVSIQIMPVQAITGLKEETHEPETESAQVPNNDPIEKAVYNAQIPGLSTGTSQLALNEIPMPYPVMDEYEERSKVGKFVASTFRSKILNEKGYDDTPLKGYEFAEAGITGINKLLGWEMALTRNTDENGDLKSVRFSSRMIKFNAPVKKEESAE